MLIIYLILIVGQFALAYFQVFQDPNILSFIADLSFVIVLLLLIHTFVKPRAQVYVYAGLTLFLGILMLVFVLYGRFYNEIPTYHSLSLIGEVGVVKDSATSLLKWYDWLFFASILLLPVVLYLDLKKVFALKPFPLKEVRSE
ncbi:hypothetical protein LFLEISCH_04310 [Listeria fleischmannii subsp. fleischmannii LU2006-1]|nr:hypothetical protein LFLEISCH_04310 [Listeria fleischmannii subsp. fleischmannii LU2006-1]